MHSKEALVREDSQFFVYIPGAIAARVYLYPLITGYFYYEPGYYIRRSHYDNYLLMYVNKGELSLSYEDKEFKARQGQVVFIDCRRMHGYGNCTDDILELAWLHFDGKMASSFYELISENSGFVISPADPYQIKHQLDHFYETFASSSPLQEADASRRITDMLTELINARNQQPGVRSSSELVKSSLAFINEHFRENISLEMIANHVSLSPYYFTRIFSVETGFTPHQYLIAARINFAKYHLQNGRMSIKEISFLSGFNSESAFCASFKKREGITPGEYRASVTG